MTLNKFGILMLAAGLCACTPSNIPTGNLKEASEASINIPEFVYRLGAGDKIRVFVFGEEEMSGEFEVSNQGNVSLPYIQDVKAQGLESSELEKRIEKRYIDEGILKNPKISVEVLEYRPFYIHGEVNQSGEFPYKSGMDIRNAVAVAGGYTYRADNDTVYIRREGATDVFKVDLSKDKSFAIYPGDNIQIPERFF